eukprot:TRINITY_DN1430_c0_g1_i2.p1 TRINITY_DN1430_c0_g1~~TRINITY_DN1430_c0_g1_i2.p1  ORF type:complete len:157 (-),score=28.40 TRINITY_DN1430_c0_g1_i2:158-628(-)
MNGLTYNKYMGWLANANSTFQYYNLWSVWTNFPGTQLLPNFECFAFDWVSFLKLRDLGVNFYTNVTVKQGFISLYSASAPTKVNINDPSTNNLVVSFYETLELHYKQLGWVGFFLELFTILEEGIFYVRADNSYYRVVLDNFPYFGIHFVDVPLPK